MHITINNKINNINHCFSICYDITMLSENMTEIFIYAAIFTAEAAALLYTVSQCKSIRGKHFSYSVSLTTIKAVKDIEYRNEIRTKVMNNIPIK